MTISSAIKLGNTDDPSSFLLPFLTKLFKYFEALNGKGTNNANLSYGGLDFAYRDFLANLNRFDPQNKYGAIIPTEISITLDGIGGIVIGNLFQINQDIVPKAYQGKNGLVFFDSVEDLDNNATIENIIKYFIKLITIVDKLRKDKDLEDSFFQNEIDNIVVLLYTTKYKLENLE